MKKPSGFRIANCGLGFSFYIQHKYFLNKKNAIVAISTADLKPEINELMVGQGRIQKKNQKRLNGFTS